MRLAAALLLCAVALPAIAADVAPLIDTDGPAEGRITLALAEVWRAGGEDGEVIFGRISDVARHANGEIYVLDNQLCQVEVFGPEGEHLRTLSRQGDGPGEVRQPTGVVLLGGDRVGIGAGFPGKMVTLQLDGTPERTRYPIGEPSDGNIGVMISLEAAGGLLGATGGRIVFDTPTTSYTERFLAIADAESGEFTRILQRQTPIDPTGQNWDERADYYFDGRWDLGPDGRIYVPMERDRYVVSVYDRTGELQQAFGRNLEPRQRTDEDKRAASPIINASGQATGENWKVCDHDEAVDRIMVDPDDGSIWVLTPHGANDQPDGILQTWDVFSPEGEFLREVAVPLGHEVRDGACFLVGDGIMIVIRGTGSATTARDLAAAEDDEDAEPLEVICYRIG